MKTENQQKQKLKETKKNRNPNKLKLVRLKIMVTLYNTGALICINSSLTNAQLIIS